MTHPWRTYAKVPAACLPDRLTDDDRRGPASSGGIIQPVPFHTPHRLPEEKRILIESCCSSSSWETIRGIKGIRIFSRKKGKKNDMMLLFCALLVLLHACGFGGGADWRWPSEGIGNIFGASCRFSSLDGCWMVDLNWQLYRYSRSALADMARSWKGLFVFSVLIEGCDW